MLPDCPADFERRGAHCYWVSTTKATSYDDATDSCIAKGGKLAEPRNSVEMDAISAAITAVGETVFPYYFGVADIDDEDW